jgi:hypothetical protein
VDNFTEDLARDLEYLKKRCKIIWVNDQVRQDAIDLITDGGNKRENYRRHFKRMAEDISREWKHDLPDEEKSKEEPVGAGEVMSIIFDIKTTGKYIKKKYFEISKVMIDPEHYSRNALLSRYKQNS